MRQLVWLLVCFSGISVLAADEVRTWTDAQGRKFEAQLVREVDGDVTFLEKGKLVTKSLDELSKDDQRFIREAEAGKKVEETPRPAGAPLPETSADNSFQPLEPSAGESKPALTKQKVAADERTWRDLRGRQLHGKFVRMHQGFVVISTGPRVVTAYFYFLSQPDRDYVREILATRGELAQIPPAPLNPLAMAPAAPFGEAAPGAGPPEIPSPEIAPPETGLQPPATVGGQTDAGKRLAAESNERVAQLQEEHRKRMAEANERRKEASQRTEAMLQQSLQRTKAATAVPQESPQDLVGSCSNCKKSITREQSGANKCPHCGVIWQYEIDELGNKREIPGAASALAAASGTDELEQTRTGWEVEPRHIAKLITRILIPLVIMLFAAIGAILRGQVMSRS